MNKFFVTVILVLIASFFTFVFAELKENDAEKRTGKREFTLKQNAIYSLAFYSVMAILVWAFYFANILLM